MTLQGFLVPRHDPWPSSIGWQAGLCQAKVPKRQEEGQLETFVFIDLYLKGLESCTRR